MSTMKEDQDDGSVSMISDDEKRSRDRKKRSRKRSRSRDRKGGDRDRDRRGGDRDGGDDKEKKRRREDRDGGDDKDRKDRDDKKDRKDRSRDRGRDRERRGDRDRNRDRERKSGERKSGDRKSGEMNSVVLEKRKDDVVLEKRKDEDIVVSDSRGEQNRPRAHSGRKDSAPNSPKGAQKVTDISSEPHSRRHSSERGGDKKSPNNRPADKKADGGKDAEMMQADGIYTIPGMNGRVSSTTTTERERTTERREDEHSRMGDNRKEEDTHLRNSSNNPNVSNNPSRRASMDVDDADRPNAEEMRSNTSHTGKRHHNTSPGTGSHTGGASNVPQVGATSSLRVRGNSRSVSPKKNRGMSANGDGPNFERNKSASGGGVPTANGGGADRQMSDRGNRDQDRGRSDRNASRRSRSGDRGDRQRDDYKDKSPRDRRNRSRDRGHRDDNTSTFPDNNYNKRRDGDNRRGDGNRDGRDGHNRHNSQRGHNSRDRTASRRNDSMNDTRGHRDNRGDNRRDGGHRDHRDWHRGNHSMRDRDDGHHRRGDGRNSFRDDDRERDNRDNNRNNSGRPGSRRESPRMRPRHRSRSLSSEPMMEIPDMPDSDEEGDEEEKAARLAAERRKKREEIMSKHQAKMEPSTIRATMDTPIVMPSPSENGPASGEDEETSDSKAGWDGVEREVGIDATGLQDLARFTREAKKREEEARDSMKTDDDRENDRANGEKVARESSKPEEGSIFDTADFKIKKTDLADVAARTGASAEDWVDREGYLKVSQGETFLDRYQVTSTFVGKGVFSTVVKCLDKVTNNMVATKIIRHNDMMKKAAQKEIAILRRLNAKDRDGKKCIIRMLETFEYRDHVCMVFEHMECSLRDALKKYSHDGRGVSLAVAQKWTQQMMIGLRHMHRHGVVHADIKPDNLLVNNPLSKDRNYVLKICDLGSALDNHELELTQYQVSRYYRCPEICLEAKYDYKIDVWSAGCMIFSFVLEMIVANGVRIMSTTYEMLKKEFLFDGQSNNDMLKIMMDKKGKLSNKLIKSGTCWKKHFDPDTMDFMYEHLHLGYQRSWMYQKCK